MTKKFLCTTIVCLLLALFLSRSLAAQSIVTGGVEGIITDPTGAAVAGAKLTLTNPATGEIHTTISSATGEFVFALLKPGAYTLSTSRSGFKTTSQTITVVLGSTVTANQALELGTSSTTVEVNEQTGPELQTQNANLSTNFEIKQIEEIPNPGNDIYCADFPGRNYE